VVVGVQRAVVRPAAREVAGAQPVALVGAAAARVAVDVAPVAVPRGGLPVVVVQPAVVAVAQQELAVELRAVLAAEQRVAVLRVAAVLRVGQPVLEEPALAPRPRLRPPQPMSGSGFWRGC
jgi:hypothetical protein